MMLLVIDVGNTNTVVGLFNGDTLVRDWRIRTVIDSTIDEYGMLMLKMYETAGIAVGSVHDIIISCVVPTLLNVFVPLCEKYFGKKPLVVGPGIKTGMPIYYDNPREVGADRIVNAVAAYEKHHRALIVVDFGTATTFDYVSEKGEYMGGCIAPGMVISMNALFERASKLPRVEVTRPKTVIGKDTVSSMQSGILYGYAGLVDGIIDRIKGEVKTIPRVVATGGLAHIVAPETRSIEEIDDMLTLHGLRIIFSLNI